MSFNELEHLNLREDSGDLSRLGIKHRTDKSWHNITANMNYLDVYEPYFAPFRNKPISLLEIGVRDGASLNLWQDYFTQPAKIVGLDIDPSCDTPDSAPRFVRIGSQNDAVFLRSIVSEFGAFDIIIDDGSHINEDIVFSFGELWSALSPGGLYVIEDLDNCYGRQSTAPNAIQRLFRGDKRPPQQKNQRRTINPFFNQIISEVDDPQCDKMFAHFWGQICIVKKADAQTRDIKVDDPHRAFSHPVGWRRR